jgi:hypothetical protein
MRTIPTLVMILAALAAAQDSKPAKGTKTEPAPAGKPVEMTLLGRKVTLAIPAEWAEAKKASTFASGDWKLAKGWENTKTEGLSLRVFGVEGKDLTPASVAQRWLDSSGKAKPDLIVSVSGKNKTLKGLDTEVEVDEKDAHSFCWMRAIALPPKDKVLIVLAEASPLDRMKLEGVVLEVQPILDSVCDATGKDPWKRDPNVTVTSGELVTRLVVPATWSYTRLAPEGSLIWMGPEARQEIVLAFPLRSIRLQAHQALLNQAAPMVFKSLVDVDGMLTEQFGKSISKGTVPGHDQASDTVMVLNLPDPVGTQWQRRRLLLDGSHITSILAKHPVGSLEELPPPAAMKQIDAVMSSIKVEIVRGK